MKIYKSEVFRDESGQWWQVANLDYFLEDIVDQEDIASMMRLQKIKHVDLEEFQDFIEFSEDADFEDYL